MSDNQVNVKVTADTAGLNSGMQQGATAVERAAAAMRGHFQGLQAETGKAMQDAGAQVASSVRGMAGAFGGLVDVLATTKGGFVALGFAAAGLAGMKAAQASADMTESAMDLARALGISTNEARVLQAALDDIGGSTSEFEGAAKGLSRNLRENEADMNKLGLVTRDAAGNLRPMNDLVLDGIEVLNGYKAGADRAIVGQQLFGRGIDSSSKLLLLNRQVLKENRQAVEDLGLQTGENAVAGWTAFDAATDRAALSMKGMVKAIGESLMPVMTDLIGLFNAAMPAAITVVRGALSGLTAAFLFAKNGAVVLWETINAMVITVAEPIRALGEAVGLALVGDFSGAGAALKGIAPTIADAWGNAFDRMTAMSEETARKVKALFMPDTVAGSGGGADGGKTAPGGAGNPGTAPAEKSQMAAFEAMLEAERVVAAERDALHGMSKQAEQAFWQNILAITTLSEADRLAVTKKSAQARVAVLQQEAREADQIGQAQLGAWQQRALAAVDLEAEAARNRVALGESTKADLLAQEQAFEARRYEIRLAALQANLAALDPTKDPVQVAQVNAQLEALEQGHQLRIAEIRGQVAVESAGRLNAIWTDLSDRISSLWDKGVQAMMNGTLTWSGAFKAAGMEIGAWFGGIVNNQVKTWVFGEEAKTGATMAGTAKRLMMESWAAAKSVALWAATAVKNIMTSAWEAMAAAWKAVVGIPIIGPVLAPVMAGVAFAGVSALAGHVASAEGGYDIPAGINPVTQLHQREMVLPEKQADVIRDMADGGAGGGTVTVELRSMGGFGDFLMVHRYDLMKALERGYRDGLVRMPFRR